MSSTNKGQLSTEYLVVLGVVAVIALMVAYIVGFQFSTTGENVVANKAYWRTSEIGIVNYKVYDTGEAVFALKNNAGSKIRLTKFNIDGTNIITNPNGVVIPLGGTATVNGTVPTGEGTFNFNIDFEYDTMD